MGFAPCPRCGRPHGRPVVHGRPDRRTRRMAERGLVVVGGAPGWLCASEWLCVSCGCVWPGGDLPVWWPPRTSAAGSSDAALRERVEAMEVVVDAARDGSGREALALVHARGPEVPALVVPSDLVLLAEVLDAAERVCRAVEAYPETLVAPGRGRVLTVGAAIREFDDAVATWAERGRVDFAAMPDDPGIVAVLESRARLEALVGSGTGSVSPDPGPGWDDELSEATSHVIGAEAVGWVRYMWSFTEAPSSAAPARLRIHALGRIHGVALDLLDGGSPRERGIVHDPGMPRERIRALAEAEGVPIGPADASIDVDLLQAGPPLERLVQIEGERVGPVLLRALGASELIASVWASSVPGARYPVAPAVVDEIHHGSDLDLHAVQEWFDDGMPLR